MKSDGLQLHHLEPWIVLHTTYRLKISYATYAGKLYNKLRYTLPGYKKSHTFNLMQLYMPYVHDQKISLYKTSWKLKVLE